MGVVYKARDPYIGRLVALKTITTGLAENPDLLERFYREAQSAGDLQHPNIVTIFELGKEGDTPFIAMQYLDGGSLDKLIESKVNIPLSQKVGYIVFVCRALDYAHKHEPAVIHRDIKPGNVMVTKEGVVKVVDFGIARVADKGKTQTGSLIGTFAYMAPSMFKSVPADVQSDIWAVGIMFYELLVGRRPFEGDNAATLMMNIVMQETPNLNETAPGTPPDVIAVVEKLLKKDVGQRFKTMDEVLIELEPIWRRLQQTEVSAMLSQAEKFVQARDLNQAQDLLSRALQIETSNTRVRSLHDKVKEEIRRDQILPKVREQIEKGKSLLDAGRFDEAKAAADAAIRMDSVFQPARELLVEVQAAAEKNRALAQAIRIAKQRLAEGDFTEAEQQLTRALEIDSTDASAQDLLRQIRDEQTRRDRQKRVTELLHRCRSLWSELRYDECIRLLLEGQKEFPKDIELAKLLETARQDQAEQEKQVLLTECRNLLRGQQFDEALAAAERVLSQFPSDSTAMNLRTHAQQGREQQRRERQLQKDLSSIRSLVKDEKYAEAIARGEQLLQEFPKEFELDELIAYARSEQTQQEQKARRERWREKIRQEMARSHFPEAIQDAETALAEFPRDVDFKILLENAKKEKAEKEKRDILDQRVREIKSRIVREELTEAMDLARQTIVTVGQDTDITQLLHQAEMEYGHREKKKLEQQETIGAVQSLIGDGKFADATMVLREAAETRLFSEGDPRLGEIRKQLEEIEAKTSILSAPPAPPQAAPFPSRTQSGDPGKDYVYQKGAPQPHAPVPAENLGATAIFSATSVTGPSVQPLPAPPPLPVPTAPEKGKKSKRQQQPAETTLVPADQFAATNVLSPAEVAPKLAPPPVQVQPERVVAVRQPAPAVAEPAPVRVAAPPLWKRPAVIAGAGLALALVVGIAIYSTESTKTTTVAERAPAGAPGVSAPAPTPAVPAPAVPAPAVPAPVVPAPAVPAPAIPAPAVPAPVVPAPATSAAAAVGEDPKVAINAAIDDLSRAFGNKDMNALRSVWPSISKTDDAKLAGAFKTVKSFTRKFAPTSITVNGDTATVAGSYTGSYVIGSTTTPVNGPFQATLKKMGARWTVAALTMP